ncbi:MAG: imidazole glycerol phosphate synthase subunit HisH [Clostridia bacterium]|nr:imidazole glycerol phosphate synthase subunit HisH [Clostridia bacterium]
MVAVIDYGVGNLFSLLSSLKAIGADAVITNDVETIKSADRIILPGVGAFEDAAKKLFESGLHEVIIEEAKNGKPLMGICLGMQLLFERSFEYGEHRGLGLIKGDIMGFDGKIDKSLKIPQIGWNALKLTKKDCSLWKYIKEGDYVYFVHSYFAALSDATASSSEYGVEFTAAVSDGNIYGCQFHPEKSGDVGLNILRGFCEM